MNHMGQEEIVRITIDQFGGETVEVIHIGGGMPMGGMPMGGMPMGGMPMGVQVREERRMNGMGQEEIVRITTDQFGEKVEVIHIGGGMPMPG